MRRAFVLLAALRQGPHDIRQELLRNPGERVVAHAVSETYGAIACRMRALRLPHARDERRRRETSDQGYGRISLAIGMPRQETSAEGVAGPFPESLLARSKVAVVLLQEAGYRKRHRPLDAVLRQDVCGPLTVCRGALFPF